MGRETAQRPRWLPPPLSGSRGTAGA